MATSVLWLLLVNIMSASYMRTGCASGSDSVPPGEGRRLHSEFGRQPRDEQATRSSAPLPSYTHLADLLEADSDATPENYDRRDRWSEDEHTT